MRILVAVDESHNCSRAIQYVGSLLHNTPDIAVTLFHVSKPMPRELLEHGGSENPDAETRLSQQLHKEQEAWIRTQGAAESQVLSKACDTLIHCGLDRSQVTLKTGHEDDVARNILEEAKSGSHETIVVGRHGTSGIKRFFGGSVTDQLLRDATGLAIWVVE